MSLTHVELQSLLIQKKEEVLQQGKGELGKVEKLAKEFLQMNVPHAAEILDVAAGSGILSCLLQFHGYSHIDALDEDPDVIDSLKKLNLYRNYISRAVKGVRSTGLEDCVYDVIITAGGFSKDAINPHDITELLRILRPEGHLLWSMRTAEEERSSEFGLLCSNLSKLELDGKIKVVTHQRFLNYDAVDLTGPREEGLNSATGGEFYAIKKLPTPLPYFANREVSTELKHQIENILKDSTEPENRIRFYDEWSQNYEQDLVLVGNYSGHIKCVDSFLSLNLDRTVSILDLACGTGLLGDHVSQYGYENIDGLDCSLEMLNQARNKALFKDHILAQCVGVGSLPLHDDAYDVVMSSNGFAPGQIYPEALEEIIRILRPKGYLILTMREGLSEISPRFQKFDLELEELVKSEKCEVILGPVSFPRFVLDHPGVFYMIRKLPASHLAYSDIPPEEMQQ